MNCYLSKYIFVQIINKFYSPKRVTIGPYLPQTMGQARRVENEDPHRWHESFQFFRGQFPSWSREKLIESIFPIEMEKRTSVSLGRNPLYFSILKVKANVYDSSFNKDQFIEDHSLFSCFQRVFPMTVTMYERSSKHLKEKWKRMVICPTITRGSSFQIWHEVTSIEVRH